MTSRSGARSRPYASARTLITAIVVPPSRVEVPVLSQTKIRLSDTRLLSQTGRGAVGHDPALLEHVRAGGDLQRAHDVLLDEQDRHALAARRRGSTPSRGSPRPTCG